MSLLNRFLVFQLKWSKRIIESRIAFAKQCQARWRAEGYPGLEAKWASRERERWADRAYVIDRIRELER